MIRLPVVRMDGKSYCQVGLLRTPCDGNVPVPAYFMTGPVALSWTSRLPHSVVVFTDIFRALPVQVRPGILMLSPLAPQVQSLSAMSASWSLYQPVVSSVTARFRARLL